MENNSYVFISYAHADSSTILPILGKMKEAGIRLWFDEGIEAGSEWPEYIAEKVMHCTKFLLFISPSYLNSQNCKRELNFAISRKKDILAIHIEDVELSPGMEMQLGTYQSIFKKRFSSFDDFCSSICRERFFDSCADRPVGEEPKTIPANTQIGHDLIDAEPIATPVTPRSNPLNKPKGGLNSVPRTSGGATIMHSQTSTYSNPQTNGTTPTYTSGYTNPVTSNDSALPTKSRMMLFLLAIFLGAYGAHKFYLGDKKTGTIFLIATILTISFLPFVGLALWISGIVEIYKISKMTSAQIKAKYRCLLK